MHAYRHLVFRGDQHAYAMRDGGFPYIDHAAAAGANGVHVWFWAEPFRAVAKEFFAYCRERGIGVHLGIGIGAYGVCDGQDPLDPEVMARIKGHLAATLDEFDVAGIEFQTGEYDKYEYQGDRVEGKTHSQQLVEHLNPYIDYILDLKPSIWLRTELHAGYFPPEQMADVARNLDPHCTVEWSRFTGPFRGPDCYQHGRELLALDDQFTWFLKIAYNRQDHWHEIAADRSLPEMRKWAEHWRGWVKLLAEHRRPTLTVCHVTGEFADQPMPMASAAVALAKNPDLPIDTLMAEYFGRVR